MSTALQNREQGIIVGMIKVSDYVMQFIAGLGVEEVFYVSGGGAMHLNDSLGKNIKLHPVAMLHEQGASIAAEAYARIKESYGVCMVTSGPGGTNAVTGVAGAYLDATPVIFISGQVKRDDLTGEQGIRQFGIQEIDILSIVRSVTNYAVQIREPEDIRYELEKAAALAKHGKPGPVWIDIPLDIQASQIEEAQLRGFDKGGLKDDSCSDADITRTIELFNHAERPVLLLGHGIRSAGAVADARELYEYLGIPVLTSWNGMDLIEDEHPLFYGRPGAIGHRSANFIQQNADFVLTIGSRLNLLATGYNYESFLEKANHVMVEIDEAEMNKKSVHPEVKICADAGDFIRKIWRRRGELNRQPRTEWMEYCRRLKDKYPRFLQEQEVREGYVNTYHLVDEISWRMQPDDIYQLTSSGTSVDISMQTFRIKWGQRAFLTKGLAAMGYDIPACVGSCIASKGKRTVCVTGDGSAMMNIQELEVIRRYALPVKLFVVDNSGYAMIYGSQNGNFDGRLTGCTEESGLTLPDIGKLSGGFGIPVMRIENEKELGAEIERVLKKEGPVICIVNGDITQKVLPKQTNYMREDGQMASRPLEDMSPLLNREELKENMLEYRECREEI